MADGRVAWLHPPHIALSALGLLTLGAGLSACTASPEPVYCYRTLAQADCYGAPQPGQGYRLLGYFGPPPPRPDGKS